MKNKLVKSGEIWFARIATLIMFYVLSGCAIPGSADPDLSKRLEQNGYSFMPPDQTGWFIAERTSDRVALAKVGRVEGQAYLIEGAQLALDDVSTSAQLTRFADDLFKHDLPPPRFRIRQQDISETSIAGAQCALSHIVAEDREPEIASNVMTAMLVESAGTVCMHPMTPGLGITLNFTHRSFPEDRDKAFEAYAESVLRTQQFSSVNTKSEN